MRIAAAISGGVDSAVAAALLSQQGHDVVGVTLKLADLSQTGLGPSRCCSREDLALAKRVAEKLGIEHYLIDLQELFRREVLVPFAEAYRAGETPSPCVRCNSAVKFGELLEIAGSMGAETLATGHYARCERKEDGAIALRRGLDLARDQSYFLFELRREQLERVVFPLGALRKDQVRQLARTFGLPNAERPDSQEVCFVPSGLSYADVMERVAGVGMPQGGEIVDENGRVCGVHRGIHRYTVGQRRGLGVAGHEPHYVIEIQPERRRVVVGPAAAAKRRRLELVECNWLAAPGVVPRRAAVQVRSRHDPVAATISAGAGGTGIVEFDEPVLAPAPGQAAVAYDGDRVLGGGWIVKTG